MDTVELQQNFKAELTAEDPGLQDDVNWEGMEKLNTKSCSQCISVAVPRVLVRCLLARLNTVVVVQLL